MPRRAGKPRAEDGGRADRVCRPRVPRRLGLEGVSANGDGLRHSAAGGHAGEHELEAPIFTPATKAETGHDENITFARMVEIVGRETAETLRERSLDVFRRGRDYARQRGIIIADTKFEFGRCDDGQLILIDEVLTPDSSRFWPADRYAVGTSPPSFDKQFVRDWLSATDWDKNSPPPELPDDVVAKTRAKYIEAYERLTGQTFPW